MRTPARQDGRPRALTMLAAGAAIPTIYAATTRGLLRRTATRLMDGDVGALLRFYSENAELAFPGDSSWGRVYRGRSEIEGFLRRFLAAGLRGETHDVLVNGPPWDTRIAIRFTDHARSDDGNLVYANRAIIFMRARWFRIVSEEVYEDTQKVAEFDAYLSSRDRGGGAAAPARSSHDGPAVKQLSAE